MLLLFFPKFRDEHFYKDAYQVPFNLKNTFDYKMELLADASYSYERVKLKKMFDNVHMLQIHFFSLIKFFFKNSKKTKLLVIFSVNKLNLLAIVLYKIFNSYGKVYLKMDVDEKVLFKFNIPYKPSKSFIFSSIIYHATLFFCNSVSCETNKSLKFIKNKTNYPSKFLKLRNCVAFSNKLYIKPRSRKNIILFIGRLDSRQKNIWDFFKILSTIKLEKWSVTFLGGISQANKRKLYEILDTKYHKNISFKGHITNNDYYNKLAESKILCSTSLYEGSPISLVEASFFSLHRILYDFSSSSEYVKKIHNGKIFKLGDTKSFSKYLQKLIYDENLVNDYIKKNQLEDKNIYLWNIQIKKLAKHIESH